MDFAIGDEVERKSDGETGKIIGLVISQASVSQASVLFFGSSTTTSWVGWVTTEDLWRAGPMDPIVLVKVGTDKPPLAYACGKCGVICRDEPEARRCHEPAKCSSCGARVKRYITQCGPCSTKEHAERRKKGHAEEFAAAAKVPLVDYEGDHVFCQHCDQYMAADEVVDHWLDNHLEVAPASVEGTTEVKFHLDAGDIIDNGVEQAEADEDALERISGAESRELQELLDGWCERVGLKWYQSNPKVAILLDAEIAERCGSEED